MSAQEASSEALERLLLRVARPGLPHALWLLDSALPLAEEAAEVTAPAIKAPDTAPQPPEQMGFSPAAATSAGGKDGDEPGAQPRCRDRAPGGAGISPRGVAGWALGSGRSTDLPMALPALRFPPSCAGAGRDPPALPLERTEPGRGRDGTAPHGQAAGSRGGWGGAQHW